MPKRGQIVSLALIFIICLVGLAKADFQSPFILKTQTYNYLSFSKSIAGLFYPQFIDYQENPYNITIRIFNQTSQTITNSVVILKKFQSDCEFALDDVDYGYYTKFPKYQIIGECNNSTNSMLYNVRLYRSGDWQIKEGDIVQKSQQQKNCEYGPLRVNNFYSTSGGLNKEIYRFCAKKQGPALYKQYVFDSKRAYVFKEDSISQLTGLSNMSIVDILPSLGPNGKYNAYLSQTYGLIMNSGSKFNQFIYKIPGGEKPYKVQRFCWSNNLAILTEGYIYFVKVDYFANSTVGFTLRRKSDKIDVQTTSKCDLFTIGKIAICSIFDGQDTKWYMIGDDTTLLKNQTEIFKNKDFKPYVSEQLCTSNSFYESNSRYQLYFKGLVSKPIIQQQSNNKLIKNNLKTVHGKIVGFIDTGTLLVVTRNPNQTSGSQNQVFAAYDKSKFDLSPNILRNGTISINITSLWLEYEYINRNGYNVSMVSVAYSDTPAVRSYIQVFVSYMNTSTSFTLLKDFNMDLSISNLAYFKNLENSDQKYYYAVQTPIQRNAIARLFITTSAFQLRYPYEFEANSFTMCSITTADNQLLLYRKDQVGLTVIRAGLRFFNFLALDDIRVFNQYRNYNVSCAHDGLFLSSTNSRQIIVLNNDLQIQYSLTDISYDDLKFTKSLILLKAGNLIEVRSIKTGDLVGVYRWSLDDIVTNIHSIGFINRKEVAYYQFGNQARTTLHEHKYANQKHNLKTV